MIEFEQEPQRYSTIARLFALVSRTPQDQLMRLLKQLLGDQFTKKVFQMILELSDDQQRALLQRLEGLEMEDGRIDKREYVRKACLIGVTYTCNGKEYSSYILDIGAFGVFIETPDPLPLGSGIAMRFILPGRLRPFKLQGQVVWSGMQGIGVKFKELNRGQLAAVQSFAEKLEDVYEIVT
ncbi:MAG TPA: PilZ domain-containing protein [Desulfobacterales bacterium]